MRICIIMWEKGVTTKPQIYYNNKHASTPQASKRKKRQFRSRQCTLDYTEVENIHKK